jgi:hypothetical protein
MMVDWQAPRFWQDRWVLPKWVTDNAESLRDEARDYVALTPAQRGALVAIACRTGAKLLRARPDAALVLERVDPLPESSERALTRMRALQRDARDRTE